MGRGQNRLFFGIHGSSLVNKAGIGYKWNRLAKISTDVLRPSRVFRLNKSSGFLLFDEDFYVSK